MAQWLSWLERRPVTAEVEGSSPFWVVNMGSQLSWESICLTSRGSQVRALQVPFNYIKISRADVAQLAEQLICNQQVIGSSPIIGFYGWVPEWPKGADCKSVSNAFGGSNPPPSIGEILKLNIISRGGAVWKLVGLITRRSQVQILPPQLCPDSSVGRAMD